MNGLIHLCVQCFSRLLRGSGMAEVRANLEDVNHSGCAFGDCCFALFSACHGGDSSPHPPCFADRNHEQNESFLPLVCQMFFHRRNLAHLSGIYSSLPNRCIFIFTSIFYQPSIIFPANSLSVVYRSSRDVDLTKNHAHLEMPEEKRS